jgi:hypothetical protein
MNITTQLKILHSMMKMGPYHSRSRHILKMPGHVWFLRGSNRRRESACVGEIYAKEALENFLRAP